MEFTRRDGETVEAERLERLTNNVLEDRTEQGEAGDYLVQTDEGPRIVRKQIFEERHDGPGVPVRAPRIDESDLAPLVDGEGNPVELPDGGDAATAQAGELSQVEGEGTSDTFVTSDGDFFVDGRPATKDEYEAAIAIPITDETTSNTFETTEPTRDELYERAQELDIEGRSTMDKAALADAVAAAEANQDDSAPAS